MRIIGGLAAAALCIATTVADADVLPTGGQWNVEAASLPAPVYGGCAAYDPASDRIYVVGGNAGNSSAVRYFDVGSGTTGTVAGALASSSTNYDTNSCVVINRRIWYATYNQMCNFDLTTVTGTCASSWVYPAYTSGPALATNGTTIYVVSNYLSAWSFDTQAAIQNLNPWRTLPNQLHYRYDYPGAAYYDGYLYAIGGSYETTAVERLDLSAEGTPGFEWEPFGALPVHTFGSGFVQVGQIVYVLSGQLEYSYSAATLVYDLTTGQSTNAGAYLNAVRLYAGWARVGNRLYALGGYGTTGMALSSIERFNLPYDGAWDNDDDGLRDAFDDDDDDDGDPDWSDPCPMDAAAADVDGDGLCEGDDPCPVDTNNDSDGDGLCLVADVCPYDADNDADLDGICGEVDACDLDPDNDADDDAICGDVDACPTDPTNDVDGDAICGLVDLCPADPDNDADHDGTCADQDPCPLDPYDDADHDAICGDVDDCPFDPLGDVDGDGLCSPLDGCPLDADNDADVDGRCGNVDFCPADPHNDWDVDGLCADEDPCPRDPENDADGDGLCAGADTCPRDPDNDADGDGLCADQDGCPANAGFDLDGDGICGAADICPLVVDDQTDSDGDGIGDACEPPGDGGCNTGAGGGGLPFGAFATLALAWLAGRLRGRSNQVRARPGGRRREM